MMKIKVRTVETLIAILIAILLIMAKAKSMKKTPEKWVREPLSCEVESMIAANTETEIAEVELMTWEYVALADTETIETMEELTTKYTPSWNIPLDESLQKHIVNLSKKYEIAPELIIAICMQESRLDQSRVGDNGKAFGLGQIREDVWQVTADTLGLGDYKTNAYSNIEMVYYIISQNMKLYGGNLRYALNGYRHGTHEDCFETAIGKNYADIVFENIGKLEELRK